MVDKLDQRIGSTVTRRLFIKTTGVAGIASLSGYASKNDLKRSVTGGVDRGGGTGRDDRDLRIVDTKVVAQLTGTDSLNQTAKRWNVHGTDLGHMFTHRGDTYMVFGDTFGPDRTDWRSNVMAGLADHSSGRFTSMITGPDGDAKELLGQEEVVGEEVTIIPTYGVSDGSCMYLHYMAVGSWDPYRANHSGLAYSDTDGQTWTVAHETTWPGDSHFVVVSIVEHDGYFYFFGSGWRDDGAALARVRPETVLDIDAYEYWIGSGWKQGDESAAVLIVPPRVGELSVRWSPYHDRWLMMHLDYPNIVLRTAQYLVGPWDEGRVVASADRYPKLYAPYMVPTIHGPTVTFTMSRYFPFYNVLLMRTRLE